MAINPYNRQSYNNEVVDTISSIIGQLDSALRIATGYDPNIKIQIDPKVLHYIGMDPYTNIINCPQSQVQVIGFNTQTPMAMPFHDSDTLKQRIKELEAALSEVDNKESPF